MFGAVLGAGLDVITGLETQRTNRVNTTATNKANLAMQREANRASAKQAQMDRRMQKEFAQHGVGWKVEDARKSGIDPIMAMGSHTLASPSGQPMQASQSQTPSSQNYLAGMGQNLGSAIDRFLTQDQRKAEAEGQALDNRYKEIRNMMAFDELVNKQSQSPVAAPSAGTRADSFPIAGQTDSAVKVMPAEVTIGKSRGKTAGTHHFGTDYVDDDGYLWEVPSEKLSESMESDWASQIKNTIIQAGKYVKGWFVPKKYPATQPRKGYVWLYDRLRGQWQEVPEGGHKGANYKKIGGKGATIYKGKIYDKPR